MAADLDVFKDCPLSQPARYGKANQTDPGEQLSYSNFLFRPKTARLQDLTLGRTNLV
jgi:hypothetical protein